MEKQHNLVMVYPHGLFKDYYTPFYDDFIKNYLIKYLTDTDITLLVDKNDTVNLVEKKFGVDSCKTMKVLNLCNIWIKDWMPIYITGNRKPKFIKTKYEPRYLSREEKENIQDCNLNGIKTVSDFGYVVASAPLILDGGNFTHNSNGMGLTTNRVVSENEELSIDEIRQIFLDKFGIDKLIILPVEPGDVTGHVDGTARFVGKDMLLVGDYPPAYREGHEFSKKIRAILESELPDCRIIPLRNEVPEDLNLNVSMPSATGNHVNFLFIENKIFLPDFGLNSDDIAFDTLSENLPGIEVIRVKSKYLSRISKDGGVLNCITWQF